MTTEATETHRHACEVRSVVAMYQNQGGEAVKAFLVLVAKHRGQECADRLRREALALLKNN